MSSSPDCLTIDWPRDGLENVRSCPICDSRDRAPLYVGLTDRVYTSTPGKWDMYLCATCGSAYLDPRPTSSTIHLAYREYYTHIIPAVADTAPRTGIRRFTRALGNGYRNWRYGTREEPATRFGILVAWLFPRARRSIDSDFRRLPRPRAGARLLDVGFGSGAFLDHAKLAGWRVTGIDTDPLTVSSARARGLEVYETDLESYEVKPGSFDVITLSHVIEHVHDPRAFVTRTYNLLKPGGIVWIETPNQDSYGHRRFGRHWRGLEPPRHLALFSWRSLESLLRETGFVDMKRLTRHEVYAELAVKSQGISGGWTPETRPAPSTKERVANWFGGFISRLDYRLSEFATLLAAKPRQSRDSEVS